MNRNYLMSIAIEVVVLVAQDKVGMVVVQAVEGDKQGTLDTVVVVPQLDIADIQDMRVLAHKGYIQQASVQHMQVVE